MSTDAVTGATGAGLRSHSGRPAPSLLPRLRAALARHGGYRLLALIVLPGIAFAVISLVMNQLGIVAWDTPAHLYKIAILQEQKAIFWDNNWYGGAYDIVGYGLVFYLVAQFVDYTALVVISAGVLPVLFYLYMRRSYGDTELLAGRLARPRPGRVPGQRAGPVPLRDGPDDGGHGAARLPAPHPGRAAGRRRHLRQPRRHGRRRRLPGRRADRPALGPRALPARPALPLAGAHRAGAGRRDLLRARQLRVQPQLGAALRRLRRGRLPLRAPLARPRAARQGRPLPVASSASRWPSPWCRATRSASTWGASSSSSRCRCWWASGACCCRGSSAASSSWRWPAARWCRRRSQYFRVAEQPSTQASFFTSALSFAARHYDPNYRFHVVALQTHWEAYYFSGERLSDHARLVPAGGRAAQRGPHRQLRRGHLRRPGCGRWA